MKNARRLLAGLALLLILASLPAFAGAKKGVRVAPAVEIGDTLPDFGWKRGALGITASNQMLFQARIAGYSLSLRVHGAQGDPLLFEEDLMRLSADTEELRLSLRVKNTQGGATLQLDQRAADILAHACITQIVIADWDMRVIARYRLADIQALRDALSLTAGELLCLSGEDSPVTVVSEDGVRRQIAL